jgi:hypothetical protein
MACAAELESIRARIVEHAEAGLPVLRATVATLRRLEAQQDRIAGNALANAILLDPFMTLRVLKYLHGHRTRSQTADITTMAHAIMMLGQARFFREFHTPAIVEDQPAARPAVIERIHESVSAARLAALLARDFAVQRHDIDPEEVMVAALVHDVTEPLIMMEWPDERFDLDASAHAGLRAELFRSLGIPGLVTELTEDGETHSARVINVRLACELARRANNGWYDPHVHAALAEIQRLLHISAPEVWERVRKVVLNAAREWRFYGVRPVACRFAEPAPG